MDEASASPEVATRAPGVARVAAGAAGVLLLIGGSFYSGWAVFGAAAGIWIAAIVARERGRTLTRWPAWFAAFAASSLYVVVGFALLWKQLPDGTLARVREAADSAAVAQPPPEWIQRMQPRGAQQRLEPTTASRALMVWAGTVGALITFGVIAAFVATCAWTAAMLLTLGLTGRWIPNVARSPGAV